MVDLTSQIRITADASGVSAGVNQAKTSLETLRATAKSVGETLDGSGIKLIRSLERQAAAIEKQSAGYGKSKSEIAAFNAAQAGVSATAATLVERISASEKSLRGQADAARLAAEATAKLSEQERFLASIEARARPKAQQSPIDTAGQQGAALGIDATRLDPLIARWRAVELAAQEAAIAEKQATEAANFLGSLQTRVDEVNNRGKSASDLLALKAAQTGVADSAAPMIAALKAAEEQSIRTAAGEREAADAAGRLAQQQRFVASIEAKGRAPVDQYQSAAQQGADLGVDPSKLDPLIAKWRAVEAAAEAAANVQKVAAEGASFITSLQSRVQDAGNQGKRTSDLLSQQAAQRGVADSAAPLIASLRQIEDQTIRTAAAERQAAEAASFLRSVQGQAESIGKTGSELLALKAAQLGVTEQAAPFVAALRGQEQGLNKTALSAKQVAIQHQIAAVQVKDFTEQVLAGGSPIRAFAQQGAAVVSTYGGIGATFSALGSLISPLFVGLAAGTAIVAGLGYAFFEGERQSKAFADALTLTGNFAGQTEGQFNALTQSISAATGQTVGNVRDIGQALLSTGEIGPQVFAAATQAAVGYGAATGKTADEVAKAFASMAASPSKFAAEANRQLNFITTAQYEAIKAFEDNGRAADAQGIVYDALNARFPKVNENLGLIEKTLQGGKQVWASWWNAAFDIGRTETIESKLAKIDKQIADRAVTLRVGPDLSRVFGKSDQELAADQASLRKQQFRQSENADAQAARGETEKAGIAARQFGEKALANTKTVESLNKALAENARQFKAAAEASTPFTAAQQKAINDDTRKKFKPESAGRGRTNNEPDQVRRAQLQADLKSYQDQLSDERDALAFHQRQITQLNQAGEISLKEFYASRNADLAKGVQQELSILATEQDRLRSELKVVKDPSDRVKIQGDLDESVKRSARVQVEGSRSAVLAIGEQKVATKQLAESVKSFNANLLEAQGNQIGAARIRADQTIAQAAILAKASEGQDFEIAQRKLELLRQTLDQQIALTAATQNTSNVNELLQIQEERIALDQKNGATSEIQAMQATGAARAAAVVQLERQLAIQQQLADARPDDKNLSINVERTRLELDKLKATVDVLGDTLRDTFQTAGTNAIESFLSGAKTGRQAIRAFGAEILGDLNKFTAKDISSSLFGKGGSLSGVLGFGGKAEGDKAASTDAFNDSLTRLQVNGVDPTGEALIRLAASADSAAGSVGRIGSAPAPIDSTFDRSKSGEAGIADLFAPVEKSQVVAADSAADFAKNTAAASSSLLSFAQASLQGSTALGLLPRLISLITAASTASSSASGGGGSFLGSIFSAAVSIYSGGSSSAGAAAGAIGDLSATGADIRGRRALGGPVAAGARYEVNERGPELFESGGHQYLMPATTGNVIPNGGQQSGRQVTQNLTQNFAAGTSRQTTAQAAVQAAAALKRAQRDT